MSEAPVSVRLTQRHDYQVDNHFGAGIADLLADEPPPLGSGAGPSPMQLLCAAVGNCLTASLLFSLRKFKQQPEPITCEVTAEVGRNAEKRLRVASMAVRLTLGVPAATVEHLDRALASFEDFCTVTGSVRAAFPVAVSVFDSLGVQLK
jgi:uncharacterized OsmC-like protein